MEKDSLRNMLYSLARFGLFWMINLFGVIIGRTALLGILGTFIPKLALYDNPETLSLISWFVPAIMLISLFKDDAKRHTAYGRYNPFLVATTMLITCAVYCLPAFLISYVKDINTAGMMREIYFTSLWISRLTNDVEIYALLGSILMFAMSTCTYIISRKIYLRKFENGEYEYEFEQ